MPVNCKAFYVFHFMVRPGFNYLLRFNRMTCLLMVDAYAKIATERLQFIDKIQDKLLADQ